VIASLQVQAIHVAVYWAELTLREFVSATGHDSRSRTTAANPLLWDPPEKSILDLRPMGSHCRPSQEHRPARA
jgi:hypothetical protein